MRTGLLLALLLVPHALLAQRRVDDNRVVSAALPAATLEVTRGMEYGRRRGTS